MKKNDSGEDRGIFRDRAIADVLSPRSFADKTHVSRETLARLSLYADRLKQWQARINLVGRSSLDDLWRRHFLDSAQLLDLMKGVQGRVADIGTGAGFPGLVLAIMGRPEVILIEANARKCVFLRTIATETATRVDIRPDRAENLPSADALFVVARACAPLPRLLPLVYRHLAANGTALLLKGQNVDQELTETVKNWTMDLARYPSRSDPEGVILAIRGLKPNRDSHVHASFSVDD